MDQNKYDKVIRPGAWDELDEREANLNFIGHALAELTRKVTVESRVGIRDVTFKDVSAAAEIRKLVAQFKDQVGKILQDSRE